MRNFARAVRRIFIRLKLYELPRLFAPLAKGKWMLVLLITGIVLLLIGLSPFPLPELRIELPLGLLEFSVSLRKLASYGVPIGLVLVTLALLGLWAASRAQFGPQFGPVEIEYIEDREIEVTWGEEYSPAYQRNPREALRKAIAAYKEALRFSPPDYAKIQHNLGIAYRYLAEHEDPMGNLQKAIGAFEKALLYIFPLSAPLAYVRTHNNLGAAYSDLAEHKDPVKNLKKAFKAFKKSLLIIETFETAPLDYAMDYSITLNNLGIAYRRLAEHKDPVRNLQKAIEAFENALGLGFWYLWEPDIRTPQVAPLDYAKIQNNLGLAYKCLAEYEDPVGNLRKAIKAFEGALHFQTPEVAPLDYAMTQNNLGVAFRNLAAYEDPMENLERAFRAFHEALRFRTPEQTPLFYAETQYELGRAYRQRAELQTDLAQRCADLQAAVQAFREALRFRTPKATPRWYAQTRRALKEAEKALRKAGCPEAT